MPPRPAKKGGAPSSAAKNTAKAVRSTPVASQDPPAATPGLPVNQDDIVDLELKADEDDVVELENKAEADETGKNGGLNAAAGSNEEAFEDEDVKERLDLDNNEPDYEAEEEQVLDYDDREVDYEDEHQEGVEEEEIEGQVIEEEEELEEGDVVDEEDTGEDENAEEDENVGEEEEEGQEDAIKHKEHRDVVKERRKRKEFEVFVGGLEKETTEEDLRKVFGRVGEVVDVRLMKKRSKGFAFLRFATIEQAKRAVVELKNPEINGRICGVSPSHDNDTLFIGHINVTWSKETLKKKLKLYGVDEFEDLTLVVDKNNEKRNRGFAFVEFASRSEALDAFNRLRRRDVVFGDDRSAKVSFADSFVEPDDEVMAQVKTIFVDGIPASWDEDQVKEYLKEYGEIEKIELARNMPSAKRKDFGFVTFGTHDAAVACAYAINSAELGEGSKKVKVRARLSRPHQKGRVNHNVREDLKNERGPSRLGLGSSSRGQPSRFLPSRRVRRGDDAFRSLPLSSHMRSNVAPRDRRSYGGSSDNTRIFSPSLRAYDRGPAGAGAYHKSNSLKDHTTREEFHVPRSSRLAAGYGPRTIVERHPSYRDEYSSRGASYTDVIPRGIMHPSVRKPHNSESYDRVPERSHPSYRESRGRDYYDPVPGSKRPYAMLEEDPRYADPRQTRSRFVYVDDYDDVYSERLGRDYGRSRNTLSARGSVYETRHGMSYAGPANHDDMDGMYSSRYGGQYMPRDYGGGTSLSSVYTGRSSGGGGHMGSGGSRSYY